MMICVMNYIVVNLVLLVMKYIVFACYKTCIISAFFGGSPAEEAAKTGGSKKIK
jgi:hypothetical protein